ncbi:protein FAR1-RELATED SEQUENCE 5-like [Oryza glaberrima]|uniref:protein FAR1-RELATED SEQUENCE 5-like n=1 Tax=Oryza glaberrima TaxID=4538 RepID=UPI00224BE777|nr:protein FAR1-RELATED SEQUENCE 5-like [Oryza glaberrima]XP_052162798.1 protein FAR1-RELATED SEQUENCE 5-like [Oryza glaberrima]
MSSNSGGIAKEKDPENAPELVALPLVRTLRPVHAVIDPAADPRSAQLSWPGHVVLLPPYATWPHHVPTPPPAVNPANPQQNGDVAAADVSPDVGCCDEKMLPKVDMLFDGEKEAYDFYNAYAEMVGFFVRRSTLWTTSKNIITRRTFVCSREGFREKKRGTKEAKCPRPETRIGCPASMTIRLNTNGKYRLTEFVPNHNHQLATASTMHMLKAKKIRLKARAARENLVDDTVRTPEFGSEDEAYEFYSMYAGKIGFNVRRASMTMNAENVITRRMFVCSKEGFREKKRGAKRVKKPRPETRTGCPACMVIRLTSNGKYHVTEFVTFHNHQLGATVPSDLVATSQSTETGQDDGLDLVDGSADANIHRQNLIIGNIMATSLEGRSNKRFKCTKVPHYGDVGATLEYLQKMQHDNPSFFFAVKSDDDGNLTNFLWSDSKSIMDFVHFGDVVCLDSTYALQGYGRPLALFTGVNHHKQTVIFAAALLYDESVEAFRWLFDTFKMAMNGTQPKTLLTDRSDAISEGVAASWPATAHRYCVWQIYQNALQQLSQAFHGSKTLDYCFQKCLFDCEDEPEFLTAWREMLEKYDLEDNQWLADLFSLKEKWALPYGREAFCADMKSVQQKESLGTELKKHLSLEFDLLSFFKQFERVLCDRRSTELQADVDASQSTKKPPPMRVLRQASNIYTPAAFKMFEREFELYMDCMLYNCGEMGTISEYRVVIEDNPKDHFVKFDSLNSMVNCSCKGFEFVGIPCRHMLKVLDTRNIKDLPPQYFLKRWRKDAKSGSPNCSYSFPLDGDPQLVQTKRYNLLCRMFSIAAARAATSIETFAYMENQSSIFMDQVEQALQTRPPDIAAMIGAHCDQTQNPIDNIVAGGLHSHTNFINGPADGSLTFPFTLGAGVLDYR